jgi:hypothetical protein
MGTNAAVHLANIYCLMHFDLPFQTDPRIIFYQRYIDDVFGIWRGSASSLSAYIVVTSLNAPGIHWNPLIDNTIPFLDLQIHLQGQILSYKTHQKALNLYSYLPPFSCHPPATLKGFIKGELIRYARTNSCADDFYDMKLKFRARLLSRGYSNRFLNMVFPTVTWAQRSSIIQPKDASPLTVKTLSFTYSRRPIHRHMRKLIAKYADRLLTPDNPAKLLIAFRKPANLFNLLCRSHLTAKQKVLLKSQIKRKASRTPR